MTGSDTTEGARAPGTLPAEVIRTLAEISVQLSQIVVNYCAHGDVPEAEALKSSQEKLENISRELKQAKGTAETGSPRSEQLRRDILRVLRRGGPALFTELAAVTLSLPDEIRPVLQTMEREGLVEIRTLHGWQQVVLTARGRQEAERV